MIGIGILACVQKARSKETNRKCALSLLLPLCGWAMSVVAVWLFVGNTILVGIFGLVFLLLVLLGVIFAIQGLIETKGATAACGRAMAWSSICVVVAFLLLMGVGASRGFVRARAKTIKGTLVGNRVINTNLNFT